MVKDEVAIATRSFWPLVSFSIQERRWKRSPHGAGVAGERRKGEWRIKRRKIAYASHLDSHIFAFYAWKLGGSYEVALKASQLENVVLAYRKHLAEPGVNDRGKANMHFAAEAFADIRLTAPCEVVALDLEKFFDRIPHKQLKRNWASLLGRKSLPDDHYAVYKAVTEFAVVPREQIRKVLGLGKRRFAKLRSFGLDSDEFDRHIRARGLIDVNRSSRGIPQGLPISGLLANLVMFEVDRELANAARAVGGSYRRYSDDVLIIAPLGHMSALEAKFKELVERLELKCPDEKRCAVEFVLDPSLGLKASTPLQYLGFEFDGRRVLIRPQTLVKFQKRMLRAVNRSRNTAMKAVARGGKPRLRRRDLYARFSYMKPHPETRREGVPKGSFMSYANLSAKAINRVGAEHEFKEQIRRQLRGQWARLQRLIVAADRMLEKRAKT